MTPPAGPRLRDLAIGAAAGLTGGVFGVGGGLILIPLLTSWHGFPQHRAHGTSLAVIAATAIAGVASYAIAGSVVWDAMFAVGIASMFTARFGARLAQRLSGAGLRRVFAIFLVLIAARLLWQVPGPEDAAGLSGPARWAGFAALGAAVGFLAAFLGVGGGILAVPAFTLLFGMSQQEAQGTSLGVILMAAPAGAREHSRLGNVAWSHVPLLAIGALFAAFASSWIALGTSHETLTRAFALFLLAGAAHLWRTSGRRTPAAAPAPE